MVNLYTQADSNIRKTFVYMSVFLILVIFIGWFVSYYFNEPIVLWIALIYSFLSSFFSYWYSDKIVLAMEGASPIKEEDNREIYHLVENLCITAGLPMPKIYIIQSSQPNAFATGRDPKHGAIALTTGLLGKLEKTEIEGVIAHELSHIGNRDALLQTAVVVLAGVLVFLSNFFFRAGFREGFSRKSDRDSNMGGIFMILAIILLILAPLLANLMKLAISRKREFLADASGALLTRYPDGLANALEKISADLSPLQKANASTSHLYFTSPFKGKDSESWFLKLFSTHPPIKERIEALRGMKI